MPTITIMPKGKTVAVEPGVSLLEAIIASGEPIGHKCDGNVDCGTCHVFVVEGRKSLSKMQRTENGMLDTVVGVSSKSRLACQAMVGSENVTVELLSAI
jgi:2Fe-2S ferredoxin